MGRPLVLRHFAFIHGNLQLISGLMAAALQLPPTHSDLRSLVAACREERLRLMEKLLGSVSWLQAACVPQSGALSLFCRNLCLWGEAEAARICRPPPHTPPSPPPRSQS